MKGMECVGIGTLVDGDVFRLEPIMLLKLPIML